MAADGNDVVGVIGVDIDPVLISAAEHADPEG